MTYSFVVSVVLSASGGIKVQSQNMSTGMYFPFYILFVYCNLLIFSSKDSINKPNLVLIAKLEGN